MGLTKELSGTLTVLFSGLGIGFLTAGFIWGNFWTVVLCVIPIIILEYIFWIIYLRKRKEKGE